jgi:hypothetical protein
LLWEAHGTGTMPNFALTGDEADDVVSADRRGEDRVTGRSRT